MELKYVMLLWFIFSMSVIYWDQQNIAKRDPVSDCCKAPTKDWGKNILCTECNNFCCKVNDEKK